jgi:ubiquitin carboxyl-terminal hydrolase 7
MSKQANSDLFGEKIRNYIKCLNANFESSRTESFYDLQVVVRGCENLEQSFINFFESEFLSGEN